MIRRSGAIALLVLPLLASSSTAALAKKSVTVNVRVEGVHKTLFEGDVKSTVHKVNGHDGTGAHKCDGTNNGASKKPGTTLTDAFDNGAHQFNVTWRGKWFQSFDDFEITKVGPDSNTSSKFWSLELNWKDTSVGGCQQKVKKGDHVLVAFDGFGKPLLELEGPKHGHAGKAFHVKVINGRNGAPVAGAKVFGHKTDSHGKAKIVVDHTGTVRLKARKKGTIRSNELDVAIG
jgi:hypothetical protein